MDTNNVQRNPNLGKVVVFTNIDDQDFEHAFGGQPFKILAGASQHMPFDLGEHLAKHLARKILLRGDKGKNFYDPTDKSGGSGSAIWGEVEEKTLMAKILGNTYQVDRPKEETEVESMKRQIEELNQLVRGNASAASPEGGLKVPVSPAKASPEAVAAEQVVSTASPEIYETKADVIAKLNSLGIKFDARQNKEKLMLLLNTK